MSLGENFSRSCTEPVAGFIRGNMNRTEHKWQDSDRRTAITMFVAGSSYAEIGVTLGVSRCSVGGMFHRMRAAGLIPPEVLARAAIPPKANTGKGRGNRNRPRTAYNLLYRPGKFPTPPQPRRHVNHPPMTPVTLWERTGCCFPTNEGGPYLFCDNPQRHPTSYCEFHGNLMMRQE